jgi:hypothetical protein
MREMGRLRAILWASLLLLVSGQANAAIIHYNIDFVTASGPSGTGTFSFDDCTNVVVCPAFDFQVSFGSDPGVIFEIAGAGGFAVSLLGFFEGDPNSSSFPGTNFDSLDQLNLLSFESNGVGETSGVYCLRLSVGASGLCDVAPNVFGRGTWSVSPIPVPAAIWLFGTALIGMVGFNERRKAA